ncbi:MAG TPA: glycosyltransferase family 2 protein [Acidimicrobiales bacterium]|nr:glycosyltransferase family 2 protein [Acidimicrobiales bacterium]
MESLAPPVVAVIVTHEPGEWFEETLRAFAAQDYPSLSVLVLDAASRVDPTPRVAAEMPSAFVRRLDDNRGFGPSLNEVLGMVEGASHLLLCHDDVAPDPDVVHVMVEESFRSNAGVVAPKFVDWYDPERLLHVGMGVDKGGAVVDRVQRGEIDHGQHDAVRDVFLAPGGCTLVRTDLFAELGGFDPDVFVMGEDLDLCWRAQILGARVVVAPQARVRHLELLASGRRALPEEVRASAPHLMLDAGGDGLLHHDGRNGSRDGLVDSRDGPADSGDGFEDGGGAGHSPARDRHASENALDGGRSPHLIVEGVTLQSLQRRHELHAALKGYSPFHLIRVVPQLFLLAAAEAVVAWVTGHRGRARAVVHAWRWNVAQRKALRGCRTELAATRRVSDGDVRRLQLHGSARLNAYVRRAVTLGLGAANIGESALDEQPVTVVAPAPPRSHGRPDPVVEHAERADVPLELQGNGPAPATRRVVWLIVALVLVIGTRQLLGSGFPFLGQLLPLPSWDNLLHRYVSGWQPTGVGTTDPTSPATGLLGVAGMLLFGGVGLLQKVVVLGCIPLGALGMARLARPLNTAWARLTATIIYLAIPVPYDALATGRWDALVMYGAGPWMLNLMARASGADPFAAAGRLLPRRRATGFTGSSGPDARVGGNGENSSTDSARAARTPTVSARWAHTLVGRGLQLGLLEAVAASVAPTVVVVTLVMAAGLALGCVVVGGRDGARSAARVSSTALLGAAAAVVLLAPWSLALLSGPDRWSALLGLPVGATAGAGWGELLRLAVGPIGDAALAWAFLAAAALPLVIGARSRIAWAGRAWSIAVVAWACAWAAGRGWLGPVAVPPQMLLVPAGIGIALAVGLGVSAFQVDLPGYRFGWRQAAAVAAAAAAAVGMLPVLGASLGGRWDVAASGYGQATSWMAPTRATGDFRALWLGDPRVLPGGGWKLSSGLAYSLSENGLPDATAIWPGSSPGAASAVANGVRLAERHATIRLGQLLAPYAVRYIVVAETLAPSIAGNANPVSYPPPVDLLPALSSQLDLRHVISQGGFDVFVDDAALPLRAVRTTAAAALAPILDFTGGSADLAGWRPALSGSPSATAANGRVPAGMFLAAVAPAHDWRLRSATARSSAVVRSRTYFGYAPVFQVARPGSVTVAFAGSWQHGVEITGEVAIWVVLGCALLGRRRWLDWWWRPLRARRRASLHRRRPTTHGPGSRRGDLRSAGAGGGDGAGGAGSGGAGGAGVGRNGGDTSPSSSPISRPTSPRARGLPRPTASRSGQRHPTRPRRLRPSPSPSPSMAERLLAASTRGDSRRAPGMADGASNRGADRTDGDDSA